MRQRPVSRHMYIATTYAAAQVAASSWFKPLCGI